MEAERRKSLLTDDDRKFLADAVKANGGRKYMGFRLPEIIVIVSLLSSVGGFYWRTNDAMVRLIDATKYLNGFAENSDVYHSAAAGVTFKQGKPEDPGFRHSLAKDLI